VGWGEEGGVGGRDGVEAVAVAGDEALGKAEDVGVGGGGGSDGGEGGGDRRFGGGGECEVGEGDAGHGGDRIARGWGGLDGANGGVMNSAAAPI